MLFDAPRALVVTSPAIPVLAGQPALVPLRLQGREGVNALFEYELTLQTPDGLRYMGGAGSNLDLDAFVGVELTCQIELEGSGHFVPGLPGDAGQANRNAGVREISGLITAARCIGEDNRHGLYALTLRPWLHLTTLRTDCKVFQNQTPVEVIEAVLGDYPFAHSKRLVEHYPRRDYCVQYNETDFAFITRLMQEWGINYHFEHSGGTNRLVWSDNNHGFAAGAYPRIPFYPLGHKTDSEYIHGFSPLHTLVSGEVASRDYDYTRPNATLAASAKAPRNTGHADAQMYLWRGDRPGLGGADYSQPNQGADKAANQTEAQGQQFARMRLQALRQQGRRARGVGHVRAVIPGSTFVLTGHPQHAANAEYIVLDSQLLLQNVGLESAASLPDAERLGKQWQVEVRFEVQVVDEVLRPVAEQRKPKTGGPVTALVVGPAEDTAASDIHTDALGRIKVQFPWDRYGNKDQNSSCWLRVASECAGGQLGAMHIPRVGQEVVVSFLGGDPDLPLVTGRAFNQMNLPPWHLPDQQALSGFRSRELGSDGGNSAAGRSNHLLLDDSDGAIQAQLRSDHQHSSLSLGRITRVEDNAGRKDARGEGLELRSDGHGVLRAAEGLLISTEIRTKAEAHAKDMAETSARLDQAHEQHATLGEQAHQYQAQTDSDQPELAKDLLAQNTAIAGGDKEVKEAGRFRELSAAHIALASPTGIDATTPGCTHQHSGQHHAITSAWHTSLAATKSLLVSAREAVRVFAHKEGIGLVSAKEDMDMQALQASVHLLAKLDITMTANRITLTAADKVSINGGGSSTQWSAAGIRSQTTGVHAVHAMGGEHVEERTAPVVMPSLPFVPENLPKSHSVRLNIAALMGVNASTKKPDAELPFRAYNAKGELVATGIVDSEGYTPFIYTHQPEKLRVVVGDGGWHKHKDIDHV